jgi:hypothetical protein
MLYHKIYQIGLGLREWGNKFMPEASRPLTNRVQVITVHESSSALRYRRPA